jgi:probable HAF family extracellular repeat protein
MRRADPSLKTVNRRISHTIFVALVVGAIALLSLGTRPAETQETSALPLYKVQDLGTLGGLSMASGINATDKVVGGSSTSDERGHAFLYSGGKMSDLGTLGGSQSFASDINNADKVVGSSDTSDAAVHAFLYSGGVMRDLGTLGGLISVAVDINEADKVVGSSTPSLSDPNTEHAFLYSGGVMRDLGTLGGSRSAANGINNTDKVVGFSLMSDDAAGHAFLYSGGQMSDLGTLGGSDSNAFDISDADKVVGFSSTSDVFTYHAFLYSDGVMRDLNSLIPANSGWTLTSAEAINGNGNIVGYGYNPDGQQHAFLLTPYFDGFYQPVDNIPTLNKTRAGKTIPIRFSLGRDQGLDIFATGYPKSETIPCNSTTPVDAIEETASGKHGLFYNARTDRYEYEWETSSTWRGCRQFVMKLKDGSVQRANFSFSK